MVKPIDLKPPKELRTLIADQLAASQIPFSKGDLATVTSFFELLKKLTAETKAAAEKPSEAETAPEDKAEEATTEAPAKEKDQAEPIRELLGNQAVQTAFLRFMANSLQKEHRANQKNPEDSEDTMELFYKLSNLFGLGSDYLIINQLAENINRYKRIEIHEDLDLRDFYLSVTKSLQNKGITNESIIGLATATQRWGEITKKIHDTEKDDAEKIGGVVIKALNEIMQRCGDENRTSINLDQLNPTLAAFNKLYNEFVRTEKRSKHKVCELIQERMRTIIDLFIEINFGSIVSLDKEAKKQAKKQATKALNRLKKQFSSENDKPKVVTKIIDEKIEAINKEEEKKEKVTTT